MSTGPRGEAATDTDSTTAPDTSQPTARTKWFSLGVLALGLSMIVLDGKPFVTTTLKEPWRG